MKNILKKAIIAPVIALALFSCKNHKGDKPAPGDNTVTPEAGFNFTGTQRPGTDIQFTNTSKNADSFNWDFGNGERSTKQNPDKVKYAAAGVYNVILTAVKGDRRAVYQQTLAIAADNLPVAHFSYSYKNEQTYTPAIVTFKNESVNGVTYSWAVNGLNYHNTDPVVTFNQAGSYPVVLTVSNGTDEATFTDTVIVTPNSNPLAAFVLAYHPFPYTVNEPIQLVNRSKNADAWEWTFGTNGPAPSTAEHPEIKFAAAGTYTISLTAKKGNLRSAPRSINIKINP